MPINILLILNINFYLSEKHFNVALQRFVKRFVTFLTQR